MQRNTMNQYAQENARINRQDRQKVTFHGSAYPKEISQQYTPATHTEAVHCQGGPLRGLPSLSLTNEGSWIHFGGRVAKPLVSPLTPVSPSFTSLRCGYDQHMSSGLFQEHAATFWLDALFDTSNRFIRVTDGHQHWVCWLESIALSLTNRMMRLEVSQGHQTLYHSMC